MAGLGDPRGLAVAPGNVFDDDPVFGTLHAPWRVAETGRDSPQVSVPG
jgi:hypothetical protein